MVDLGEVNMDFSWTEEQLALKNAVIEFAKGELNNDLIESEGRGEFSREKWEKCARFGIQGLPIAEEYGGTGADILSTMLAMEGLGYGCHDNGLVFALNAQLERTAAHRDLWHGGAEANLSAASVQRGAYWRARNDRARLRIRCL